MVMDERKLERIKKKLLIKAEGYTCIMEDMSRHGMGLIIPALLKKQVIDIGFRLEDLELAMQGVIRWMKKASTFYGQSQYHVGVSLIDPPSEYTQLVDSFKENKIPAGLK